MILLGPAGRRIDPQTDRVFTNQISRPDRAC